VEHDRQQREQSQILATRGDIEKAKATIQRLKTENGRLKVKASMYQAHFAGLTSEVEDLRRRLGISKRDWDPRKIR
jgi:predicted RNase H-like nuclease (RuvC/YqgF family)